MAEYIACRRCDSPDCKGCNLKRLETMLENGKFDCLMNGNRCIPEYADVAPVRRGRWKLNKEYGDYECSVCGNGDVIAPFFYTLKMKYCPNCGADMRG